MLTEEFVRKPLKVEAVQVTADNLYDVAKWCLGNIFAKGDTKVVQVDVLNPTNPRHQEANIGDWVLKSDKGFKVYTVRAFERGFSKAEDE